MEKEQISEVMREMGNRSWKSRITKKGQAEIDRLTNESRKYWANRNRQQSGNPAK